MVLGLFLALEAGAAPSASPVPSVEPSPVVSVAAPTGAASPAPVTKDQASALLREFQRAQTGERKALEHQQKTELRNLKASQSARWKEWTVKARLERQQFRKDNPKGGSALRDFVRDERSRGIALQAILKDEYAQRASEHKVHRQSLKEDQVAKLKEFREYLGRGERPPERLWPASGR
jgi:hypothetical protein